MKVKERNNKRIEYLLEKETEIWAWLPILRQATLSNTMGPNFRDIYWIKTKNGNMRPCVIVQ